MTVADFAASVAAQLPYAPNTQQRLVTGALARFCSPRARMAQGVSTDRVFVLNGYAGTGKTSLTAALVRALALAGVPTVLLAPTGRAAKVFAEMAGCPAYTVHRRIYRHSLDGERPGLQENKSQNTVFIVDEASMLPGDDGRDNILADLVQYVFAGTGNVLLFLGDTAQLPPVGSDVSPAMHIPTLRAMGLKVSSATLTAIARQGAKSGILANATLMRRNMKADPVPQPSLLTAHFDDVHTVTPLDLAEKIERAYADDGIEQTIVVTRSNRRATDFNHAIRSQVLYLEDELCRGDLVMVTKNNYFWNRRVRGLDFVANGDIAVVQKVYGTETRYGMRFADVQLMPADHGGLLFDAKVMLDPLHNDRPAMSAEGMRDLYAALMADPDLCGPSADPGQRLRALRDNPYFNALQIKYAYAVTCHKAQGGQWQNVFVDMCGIAPDAVGIEFYRWLYTATTRAVGNLTFITAPANGT